MTPRKRLAGFTLTEVLIALAMTALLLIGISKIFALTSNTISAGQAAAKAMRSQRAIQQVLSTDIVGSGQDEGTSSYSSGLLPFNNAVDSTYAMPYLSIASYRVPTYFNAQAMASAVGAPADYTGTLTSGQYRTRSRAIRSIDYNNDGVISASEPPVSIYTYGDRNFRTDTLTFFARGRFNSQTSSSAGKFQDNAASNTAMIWYGHLRTYASSAADLYTAGGYGMPGDWRVLSATTGTTPSTYLPNVNNRFADQFRLGRCQFLLIEPTDQDGIPSATNDDNLTTGLYTRNTVTARGDPSQLLYFVQRDYWNPNYIDPGITASAKRPHALQITGGVYVYDPPTKTNVTVRTDDTTTSTTLKTWTAALSRTDILGTGVRTFRRRIGVMENTDVTIPPTSGAEWYQFIPTSWTDRYYVNPFPAAPITPQGIAQQRLTMADSVSQFTVEFAGDFVKQNADGTIDTSTDDTTTVPTIPLAKQPSRNGDGVLDFVVVNGVRQTRWYGMPRDVDGDGHIYSTEATLSYQHPDVIPLKDVRGIVSSFEKNYPTAIADYATALDEPTGTRGNGKGLNGTPDDTAYLCTWGPLEFTTTFTPANGTTSYFSQVPQLLRIITDVRDPSGRMKEAMSQEYVFPLRVNGSVAPPVNTP